MADWPGAEAGDQGSLRKRDAKADGSIAVNVERFGGISYDVLMVWVFMEQGNRTTV